MDPTEFHAFATPRHLDRWMRANHATRQELWVRMYKKGSGTPSVAWADCVVVALAWGWIDGQRKALDDASFLQRFTPRRAKSSWSKRNREHAERLIAEGRMQPAGLAHVEAARRDGRWEQAYAGSAEMTIPADFLDALETNAEAKAFFDALDRRNLYAIYYRLHTAKRPATRQRRIADMLVRLARNEPFH